MPPSNRTTDPSLRALEAVRGYASVIVVLHHFALAFLPGLKLQMDRPVLAYTLGWLLNGMGAVYVFFLLSGFVLTLKYYETPDVKILLIAALKRLPRLWPSALYGTLLGYLVLRYGLNGNAAAADLNGSDWLRSFSYADQTIAPNLALALRESLTMFLHYRPLHYNTNLWTMLVEFYGSLLAFFAAFVLVYLNDQRLGPLKPDLLKFDTLKTGLLKIALALSLLVLNILIPFGFGWAFSIGAVIAYAYTKRWFIPAPFGIVLSLLGLSLLGAPAAMPGVPSPLPWLPGAALLLWGITTPGAAPGFLATRFSQLLGRWSFPLYISHSIAILTLGSLLFTATAALGAALQLLAAFIATWVFAIALAYPVLRWEAWYLPRLNGLIRRLFAAKS